MDVKNNKQKTINFFKTLGYTVDIDGIGWGGEEWYEISKDGKLIAQWDTFVPLEQIIKDLSLIAMGEESNCFGDFEYKLNGGGENFDRLARKVLFRTKVQTLNPGEMLKLRLESQEAAKQLTAQEVHKQMFDNGAVQCYNPFYREGITEEESYQKLNEE